MTARNLDNVYLKRAPIAKTGNSTLELTPKATRVARFQRAATALLPGVSRDIAGTSVSSRPATNIGNGAPRPQRLSSQRARMNLISVRNERSRTIFVWPRKTGWGGSTSALGPTVV